MERPDRVLASPCHELLQLREVFWSVRRTLNRREPTYLVDDDYAPYTFRYP